MPLTAECPTFQVVGVPVPSRVVPVTLLAVTRSSLVRHRAQLAVIIDNTMCSVVEVVISEVYPVSTPRWATLAHLSEWLGDSVALQEDSLPTSTIYHDVEAQQSRQKAKEVEPTI